MVAPRKTSMDFNRDGVGDSVDDAADSDNISRVSCRNSRNATSYRLLYILGHLPVKRVETTTVARLQIRIR